LRGETERERDDQFNRGTYKGGLGVGASPRQFEMTSSCEIMRKESFQLDDERKSQKRRRENEKGISKPFYFLGF
jgi:hypothetical protein